jgi:anti-anti-sigma factor
MIAEESMEGGLTIFRLSGELDMKSAPALKDRLLARAANKQPLTIVNVERLDYVDSAGLGVLIAAWKAHTAHGGRLVLAAPTPEVRHILEITRMTQHFAVHASESEAIAALGRKP